eukprot:m.363030 g.363030  ORF g.363030 m.363030 type:complete len:453 (-) comp21323_c0_seq1:282-1640(-)
MEQGYTFAISQESERLAARCFSVGPDAKQANESEGGDDSQGSGQATTAPADQPKPVEEVVADILALTTPDSKPKDERTVAMVTDWVRCSPEEDLYQAVAARAFTHPISVEYTKLVIAALKERNYLQILCDLYDVDRSAQSDTETKDSKVAKGEVSDTASMAVWMRATGHAFGFGPDNLACLFVEKTQEFATTPQFEHFQKTGELPQAPYNAQRHEANPHLNSCPTTYMQCRTCFLDDAMETFVRQYPMSNIVILGAGYGTRCYRLNLPAEAKLFEVDVEATQAVKRQVLDTHNVEGRDRVAFVKCNFRTDSWVDCVIQAGLDATQPTFILWEGVTYYLPRETVAETFCIIGQGALAKTPTMIAFDYTSPAQMEKSNVYLKRIGEPWLFAAVEEDMSRLISDADLTVLDHKSGNEMLSRCMPIKADDGRPAGTAATYKSLVVAANQVFCSLAK